MYYVLFTWIKGKKERDFQGFKTKAGLIDFLGKHFEKIVVWNIHKAEVNYRFGLYEKENEPEEGGAFVQDLTPESDEEKPADYLVSLPSAEQQVAIDEEAIREKKQHPLLKNRKEEPSAMEKIGSDIEAEIKENNLTEGKHIKLKDDLTEAEILKKNKDVLARADKSIKAAEEEQANKKTGWRICSKCNSNRISPANKSGVCTACQLKRKTNRPYKRRAKKLT